jgi:hypothetical protein
MDSFETIIISAIVGFVAYIQGVITTRRKYTHLKIAVRSDILQSTYSQGFEDGKKSARKS